MPFTARASEEETKLFRGGIGLWQIILYQIRQHGRASQATALAVLTKMLSKHKQWQKQRFR